MTQKQGLAQATRRVFVSYSSEDGWYAQPLLDRLAKHPGVNMFATQSLSAAEDWRRRLKEEIEGCTVFLIVLARRSVESPYVLQELGAAWALGKPIVAVVADSEARSKIPLEAGQARVVEAADLEEPDALDRLLSDLGSEEAPTDGGADLTRHS